MQVAPFSQGSTCRGQAAIPALGKSHPFMLKGDLGNAAGIYDSNPEVFPWDKARCRCLLLVRGAKC